MIEGDRAERSHRKIAVSLDHPLNPISFRFDSEMPRAQVMHELSCLAATRMGIERLSHEMRLKGLDECNGVARDHEFFVRRQDIKCDIACVG